MAENKEAAKAKKEKKTDGDEGGEVVHAHVTRAKKKSNWTLDRCKKYARRFKTELEWAEGAPASYKSAQAHGWVAQCLPVSKSARRAS
jgi:hypothetical protein